MTKLILEAIHNYSLNNKLKILIIGPGKSTIAKNIISNYPCIKIDFIDHNNDSLEFQKQLLANESIEMNFIQTELSDSESLKALADNYNLILCTEVIEHVKNETLLLSNLSKYLDDNGIFIISVPNGTIDRFLMNINTKYMQDYDKNKGHVNFYSAKELCSLLNKSGYEIIQFNRICSQFTFFHLLLVMFTIPIDEDTGQIYNTNHFAVRYGNHMMNLICKLKLNSILNQIIPRNYFAILKKAI